MRKCLVVGNWIGLMQFTGQACTFSEQKGPGVKRFEFAGAALVVLFITCTCSPLWAHPILPHLFSDHMVLQRDVEIPVWCWTELARRPAEWKDRRNRAEDLSRSRAARFFRSRSITSSRCGAVFRGARERLSAAISLREMRLPFGARRLRKTR